MKTCTKCKSQKKDTEFSFKNKALKILASECKNCHRKMRKAYYDNNKDLERIRTKNTKIAFVKWFKELKSSLKCNRCGENHPATLDFHHTDPLQKENAVAVLAGNGSKSKLLAEIAKCEVLCANCHRKHHYADVV